MAGFFPLPERIRPRAYGRRQPLILMNGLAEQAESWYKNRRFWSKYFDLFVPNILSFESDRIHQRVANGDNVDVEFLVEEYADYLSRFVQTPPYNICASSLGCKIAVELAAKFPGLIHRMVLLCPSGMGETEKLPIMEGVRRSDWDSVVKSVFHNPKHVDSDLVKFYQKSVKNRRWKTGLLRTVRGTLNHVVRDRLFDIECPTLIVTGEKDRICDPRLAAQAARNLPQGYHREIPNCGHAPQIENYWLINRLVVHFLGDIKPSANPGWTKLFLPQPTRV